jgi:iron complex outermembrane recepter protein
MHATRTVALASLFALLGAPLLLAQSAPPADEIVKLDAMEITAFQRDYTAPVTATGLGIAADVYTTPLTVMSIPMDILTDQQVNNVEDALRNVAGVSKFKQGNGGEEKFSMRGFDASQSLYKDGARINNAFNATNIATTETANIERYDILKGPAAILYGVGEPGGVINYVTKKPRFDRAFYSAELIAGSYDYYRTELDLTSPLGAAGSPFAYRIVSSYEDSGSHRNHTTRERFLLAPSLSWRPGPDTTITAQYEFITDTYTQDRGQVLEGNNVTGYTYSDRLSPELFFGIPGWNDQTTSDYERFALLADHRFSTDTRVELNASTARVDKLLYDSGPSAIPSSNSTYISAAGDVIIRPSGQGGIGESDTVTARLHHTLSTGPLSHQLMLQTDYERIFNDGRNYVAANVANVTYNILNRTYSGIPTGGFILGASSPGVRTDRDQYGVVVQDLISLGSQWHALVGARYTEVVDNLTRSRDYDLSPRAGLVFRPRTDLSFYASWARTFTPTSATGFNPVTGTGVGGPVLDPETGSQLELGVRHALFDGQLELNAAVFDLRKQDVAGTDPASLGFPNNQQWSANLGETRTRGFELQAVGRLTKELRLIAGYAYLDNQLTAVGATFASQRNNALPGIPLHSGNVWAVYEFSRGALNGFSVGSGAFAQSTIFASTENRARYGGFTQIDALVSYKHGHWKLQLNAKNLTDETYNLAQAATTTDSFAAIRVGTSTPRTFTGSLAFEF